MSEEEEQPEIPTKQLAEVLFIMAKHLQSEEGMANALIAKAGERLLEQDKLLNQVSNVARDILND
jgi:hypothetical protein